MKKAKKILSLMLVLIMCFSVVPLTELNIKASAATITFDQLNADKVFLKQPKGSVTCTLYAAAMMMRRYSMLRGDSNWSKITASSIKEVAWSGGLKNSFSYSNSDLNIDKIKVANVWLPMNGGNAAAIKKELKQCPEGIVIHSSKIPHAVLITDYTDGVFYCADPANGTDSGRISLSKAYGVTINNADSYWKVTSPVVDGPVIGQQHSYTTKAETAHPHKYYKICSCGDKYYTGSNKAEYTYKNESAHPHKQYKTCWCGNKSYTGAVGTVRTCSKCWDVEFSSSKESLTIRGGNSDTFTIKISGSVVPEDSVYNYVYDTSIISVTKNEKEYTVTGLRCGETDIVFTAYTDRNKTEVITGLTIPVKVTSTPYLIQYKANGGENAPSPQVKTYGNNIALSSDEPTRDGYTFLGWSKDENATVADSDFDPGDTYTRNAMLTLYAVWKKTFYGDVNGDGVINDPDLMLLNKIALGKVEADSLNKLKGDLNGDEKITSEDVQHLGNYLVKMEKSFPVEDIFSFFEVENSGKTTYRAGEAINKSAIKAYVVYNNANYHVVDTGFTISPQYADGSGQQKVTVTLGDWSAYFYITVDDTVGYTLTYNANGGNNAPSSQTGSVSYTISSTVPTRSGYTFLGWSTNRYATTATYKPNDRISPASNITLYAVWKSASSINTGSTYSTSIDFANQEKYYTFTPTTSGDYIFESNGDLDTTVTVYDTTLKALDTDDDSGKDNNFMVKVRLSSGTKYYVKVGAYGTKSGSTTFKIYKNTVGHAHSYTPNVTKDPTCTDSGILTYSCPCGTAYTETIDAKGHEFETELTIDKEVTCTENGKKSRHCIYCDATCDEEIIEATEHAFDGSKCKNCDYDKISDCSCNCHKGGISGFFFKLINFFEKLFGKNKVCACGVKH